MVNPLVCVSLRGRTAEEMSNDALKAVEMGADIAEVRLDFLWTSEEVGQIGAESKEEDDKKVEVKVKSLNLQDVDAEEEIKKISSSVKIPILFTCRPKRQGGSFPGTEEQRLEVLEMAIASKPDWIDIEVDISSPAREALVQLVGNETRIIASQHYQEGVPSVSEISQDVMDSQQLGDIIKICYQTNDRKEALRIFESAMELKQSKTNYSLMGIGPGGDWPRIHAPALNQDIVYATTESGWHLAQQGKINASDLRIAWEVLEYA